MPLRTRLTAGTALVIALALAASAVALVVGLRHALVGAVDAAARQRARDIAAQAAAERLGNPVPSGSTADAVVQVVDANGRVVAGSANVLGLPRLFAFPASDGVRTVTGLPVPDAADTYRVATAGEGGYAVYVALPNDDADDTIRRLTHDLAAGLPLLFALLVAVTWVLVGRALRPVEVAAERQRAFVADAAHELRGPLTAVIANLEVTAAHPDPATWRDDLTTVLGEARHIARLVDDLLDLARLDARPGLDARVVDLDDVVLAELAQARARTVVAIDASRISAAQLRGDPALLSRLVRNLVDNAAGHATTRVTVTLSTGGDDVRFEVADDGPGVPAADRERIFERFTRLDSARRATGGFGLGLAIARDIVTAHGGSIEVVDGAPGARFVVRLPRSS